MRVCFIGNSHLGAIKLGMDKVSGEFPSIKPTFFASASDGLRFLSLSGRRLLSRNPRLSSHLEKTSGVAPEIDLDAYDKFVLVGLGLGFNLVGSVYRSHRTERMAWDAAQHLVSEACFATAVAQGVASTLAVRIAEMIYSVRQDPVILLPNPLLSEKILSVRVPAGPRWKGGRGLAPPLQQARVWQELSASQDITLVWEAYRTALAALPPFLKVQDQPVQTVAGTYFTVEDFNRGALRLHMDQKQPTFDVAHMNGDYGATVLRALLPAIAVADLPAAPTVAAHSVAVQP